MDTKKDIGTAIKDRLDPFKGSPDDVVWANIESALKRKKKRRALIFWSFGLGLGLLLIMLWFINPFHSSLEIENPVIEAQTVDTNQKDAILRSPEIDPKSTRSSEDDRPEHIEIESPEPLDAIQSPVRKRNTSKVQERSNFKTKTQQVQHVETKNYTNLEDNSNETISKNSDPLHIASVPNDRLKEVVANKSNLTKTNENGSTRDTAIAKRDSIRALNNRIRDSIKAQRQSERLVSEEELEDMNESIKDSIAADDASKWSITPQATLSYYGALKTKTSDNFSLNYGVLASYRMTNETYLRIGIRKLNLTQTVESDSLKRNVAYLEFPLELKYRPRDYKFNPYITGGLSYFKLQNGSNDTSNNIEYKATMSLNLGLGLETKLFKNTYFNIESNFNYQLNPFTQKNNIQPFIVSIHTGIEYRF